MVIRDLKDGSSIVSTQEDHAELSAQFAAHWGNREFSTLKPFASIVLATTYHDSGYREWEGNPPINAEKARPYAHRETIPGFESVELKAYVKNVDWLQSQDPYAGLLASMHRTGLWENRYQVFKLPKGRLRERSTEIKTVKQDLETRQQQEVNRLSGGNSAFLDELWFNYRALQIFDLLSLYFCCDGYTETDELKDDVIAPVSLAYGSKDDVQLHIAPFDKRSVKITPYPFDISPLYFTVRARFLQPEKNVTEETALEAYHKATRQLLTFHVES